MGNLTRLIHTLAICVTIHNVGAKPTVDLYTTFIVIVVSHMRIGRQSVLTIGGSGDTTISPPGMTPKQPLPGIGLHDPTHGRQACLEFISFHQRVGQISPREGQFSCRPLPKRGQNCDIPLRPQLLNDSPTRKTTLHSGQSRSSCIVC